MYRFKAFLCCIVMLLLSGCLRQTAVSQETPQQTLLPIYQEKLPTSARFFEFADNGKKFLAAGSFSFVHIYDADTFKKRVVIKEVDGKEDFSVLGAGFIDDNTWYLASRYSYPNPDYKKVRPPELSNEYLGKRIVSIRKIDSLHEVYQYDLGDGGAARVFANKEHIAHRWKFINWHNGKTYKVDMAHHAGFSYQLTSDSQVITQGFQRNFYLFNNPVKQESVGWDFGFSWSSSKLIISPDARYALYRTDKGSCELWLVPQKRRLGNCGRGKIWGEKNSRAVFQRDSKALAVSAENKIHIYSTEPFKKLITLTLEKSVDNLALSGNYLAAIDEIGTLRVWDIAKNRLLGQYQISEYSYHGKGLVSLKTMVFQPAGSKLVVTDFNLSASQLLVFDLAALL